MGIHENMSRDGRGVNEPSDSNCEATFLKVANRVIWQIAFGKFTLRELEGRLRDNRSKDSRDGRDVHACGRGRLHDLHDRVSADQNRDRGQVRDSQQ